jgi:hypothetical protein
MRSFAGRFSALCRSDARCSVLLCILVLAAYIPGLLLRLTPNPIFSTAGLIAAWQPGLTQGFPWIDPNAGFTVQALGGYSAEQWLHGHIPWWNPYSGVGLPLAAEMQGASLFFPFVLLLHFWNGVLFLKIVLQMVAGLATFALLRQLGLSRFAAFCGAALFELSGTFAWFADSPILPVAFLPLFLLGIERAFAGASRGRRGGWFWIAVALAYSIYAGFPETAYLDGLLAFAWSIYRFAISPRNARWSFARRILLGGTVGILLAAPLILPFLEYQSLSAIKHSGWNNLALPAITPASLLMPYIYGPLHAFETADPSGRLAADFASTGGYFSLTLFFLSAVALFSGKRLRGLRILLAAWIVVFAARSLGVHWASDLLRLIPPLDYVVVFHYSEPAWEMCGVVLAAFALDDWRHGIKRWPVFAGLAVTLAVAALSIALASGLISDLFHHLAFYSRWFRGSVLWAALMVAILCTLFNLRPGRISARLITALLVFDAVALFAVPELAGMRRPKLDLTPVTFLRHHLGLERAYTLGPLQPNYGAYFEVPSINHNQVPVAAEWLRYIRQSLDPGVENPQLFTGYIPAPLDNREKALRDHVQGYEAAAVKYILATPGENPFAEHTTVTPGQGANVPVALEKGETISGSIPSVRFPRISAIGVVIGTYGGAATGSLQARVCSGDLCSSGAASLSHVADNQALYIALSTPVSVRDGAPVRYAFTHVATPSEIRSHAVAIWLWPAPAGFAPVQLTNGRSLPDTPQITLQNALVSSAAQPAFRSSVADIYELPQPAPYFETSGATCKIAAASRQSVSVFCGKPATLIRRELSYPGWHAFVNGKRVAMHSAGIFQSIAMPAGKSLVSFSYTPTHSGLAFVAFVAGLLALASELISSNANRRISTAQPALVAAR